MKYSSTIDNVTAEKWGLTIQLAYLFSWLYNLPSWANSITSDSRIFYFAAKSQAVKELPLLTDKLDTMYRYYRQLETAGLILVIRVDGKDYVSLTEKAKQWNTVGFKSDLPDSNPSQVGKISEKPSDLNPTYHSTNNDKNTSDTGAPKKVSDVLKKRQDEFYQKLVPFVGEGAGKFHKDMVRAFYEYWTEPSVDGTLMRMEDKKNKYFDIARRLATWKRREPVSFKPTLTQNGQQQPPVISSPFKKRDIHA